MRWWNRLAALVVLVSMVAVPIGVAAEGYVCVSGMRMNVAAVHACSHCAPLAGLPGRHSLGRACCTYVGAQTLPEVVTDGASPGKDAIARAAAASGAPAVFAVAAPALIASRTPRPWRHPDGPPPLSVQGSTLLRL